MWLTRLAISRPVLVWMALLAIGIMGGVGFLRLPAELNPRVAIPTFTITTVYPGAGPREMESLISRPIEEAARAISGVRNVYSSSQESLSVVSVDLRIGTNLDRAIADARDRAFAAALRFPSGARQPVIAKLDINAQPILYIAFSRAGSLSALRTDVDKKLVPRLSQVAGVAGVTVLGGESREVHVNLDRSKLEAAGVTLQGVVQALQASSQDVPAGAVVRDGASRSIRVLRGLKSVESVRNAWVSPEFVGNMQSSQVHRGITVGELGLVVEGSAPSEQLLRVNGKAGVGLLIAKSVDANTVKVADEVKGILAEEAGASLSGAQVVIARDESVVVRDALEDVNASLLLGAVLAMGVVYLFLRNLRGTVIVAIALPACLVATFLCIYLAGFTLNQMTLLALSLSVGILVDDSIVVLESITRHLRLGESPEEAALNGRTEIGFADVTTTLVDVVVFLPIGFMGGIVGSFFREFGLTIVVATLFSLIVSFTVTPMLAARWYRSGASLPPEEEQGAPQRLYRRWIGLALDNRWAAIGLGFTLLACTLLIAIPNLGFEFLPSTDQGQLSVILEAKSDSSLGSTQTLVEQVETVIRQDPDVVGVVSSVGEVLGGFGAIPQRGPQFAQISIRLRDKLGMVDRIGLGGGSTLRIRTDHEVSAAIRQKLTEMDVLRLTVNPVRPVAESGAPIQLQLQGDDLATIEEAGRRVRDLAAAIPGVVSPDLSSRAGNPEVQIEVDPVKSNHYQTPQGLAASVVRDSVAGNTDAILRTEEEERPIRVRVAGLSSASAGELAQIPISFRPSGAVRVGDMASLTLATGPTNIERVNQRRMVTVNAHLAPGVPLGNVQPRLDEEIASLKLQGITAKWAGEAEAMNENAPEFAFALGLAVILVYLLMASLFNSLLNPLIIMFTLPMAMAGAIGALTLTGETFSLVSVIGIIMLTGLMGRNAILLLDYTATLRARGMNRRQAIIEAGATRLRPILMTTCATVAGMLPVALRIGRASEMRAPMAIVVIGGLLLSTALTLVIIPAVYTVFDDWFGKRKAD